MPRRPTSKPLRRSSGGSLAPPVHRNAGLGFASSAYLLGVLAPCLGGCGQALASFPALVCFFAGGASLSWLFFLGRRAAQLKRRCRELERECARLESAARRAQEESRLESEFLANVSHDLRTPMNGIIGFTALALETDLSDEQRQYLESVLTCSESLLGLLNEILDFSKLEAGKLELERVEFDLRDLMEGVGDVIAPAAGRKGLEVVLTIDPGVPSRVVGDPNRLRQVVTNLAGNAVKFTEKGEVELRVRPAHPDRQPEVLRFEVRDTGIGIAPEEQAKVFERFAQAKGAGARSSVGTGLGLAISKRLVELMEGAIGVESQLGVGSTFWFTARFEASTHDPALPAGAQRLRGLRVLVVDDNQAVRKSLSATLQGFGCEVTAISGADDPVGRLRKAKAGIPYSVAIFDLGLPGLGREEIARFLRKEDPFDDVALVVMSPVGSAAEIQLLKSKAATKVSKPIKRRQLLDVLLASIGETAKAPLPRSGAPSAEPGAQVEGARGKVLLAEDNLINQKLACRILEKAGYQVEVASTGREVIEALRRGTYAAVLMDVHMPDMDGLEATATLRRIEGGARHTPVIAMTADAREEDRSRCLAAGMDDYLSKPIRATEVLAAVERWAASAAQVGAQSGPEDRLSRRSLSKAAT